MTTFLRVRLRRVTGALVAVLILLTAFAAPGPAVAATTDPPGQAYNIELLSVGQPTGLCLAISWALAGKDAPAVLANCASYVDRSMVVVAARVVNNTQLNLLQLQNGVCLDRYGTSTSPGAPLVGWTCNSADPSQWWTPPTSGGAPLFWNDGTRFTCAQPASWPLAPAHGQRIVQASCSSSPPEWRLVPVATPQRSYLQASDLPWNCSGVQDNVLVVGDCAILTGARRATFYDLPLDGTAYHQILTGTGRCLEIHGGDTEDGAPIIANPCGGYRQQFWSFPGIPSNMINGSTGKCASNRSPGPVVTAVQSAHDCQLFAIGTLGWRLIPA